MMFFIILLNFDVLNVWVKIKERFFLKKYFFFFRIFLYDYSGNFNKINGKKEISLICVCMEKLENV